MNYEEEIEVLFKEILISNKREKNLKVQFKVGGSFNAAEISVHSNLVDMELLKDVATEQQNPEFVSKFMEVLTATYSQHNPHPKYVMLSDIQPLIDANDAEGNDTYTNIMYYSYEHT